MHYDPASQVNITRGLLGRLASILGLSTRESRQHHSRVPCYITIYHLIIIISVSCYYLPNISRKPLLAFYFPRLYLYVYHIVHNYFSDGTPYLNKTNRPSSLPVQGTYFIFYFSLHPQTSFQRRYRVLVAPDSRKATFIRYDYAWIRSHRRLPGRGRQREKVVRWSFVPFPPLIVISVEPTLYRRTRPLR